jgi:histidinol-phosphate/aromatic aminotransferase/cobyric acid decarboxylase-like protein
MAPDKTLRSRLVDSGPTGVKPKPVGASKAVESTKPRKVVNAPPRAIVPPIEAVKPAPVERYLSPEELQMERDRIYARLTSIANVIARPSPADYVVFEVVDPNVVHKKLVALGIPPEVAQKYPKIQNGMRVFVRSARKNEEFLRALEQAAK